LQITFLVCYSFILPHDTHYVAHLHKYTLNKLTTFTAAFSPRIFHPLMMLTRGA
jgi:hypothetical protein